MRCFFLLLFLDGCLCTNEKTLTIEPHYLAGWKGSCILIPCQIKYTYSGRRLNNISLIWYFDPFYDGSEYTGTILYNSSRTSQKHVIPTIAGLQERATFAGNLSERNCSLKISQLQKSDDGSYGARLYGILENDFSKKKWYHPASLNILDSPPKPTLQIYPTENKEGQPTNVKCSMSYHCPEEPITMILSGLEEERMSAQRSTGGLREVRKELRFVPTWKDHGKFVTCSVMDKGREISHNTMKLVVKHAPKGVKLRADPGTTLREGEKLSLECLVNSTYPDVLEYQWWKNNDLTNGMMHGSRMNIDPLGGHHSGHYKCGARNGLGTTESEELPIDVQYRPKDIQLAVLNSLPIKEGQTIQFNCSVGSSNPRTNWYKLLENNMVRTRPAESSLITFPAKPGRATTYHCEACNTVGCTPSPRISVNVHFAPKNVKAVRDPPGPIKEGAFLNLSCQVEAANPEEMTYRWSKDQQPLDAKGAALILQEVAPGDSGSYSCDATNSVGTTASRPLQLNVQYGPRSVSVTVDTKEAIIEGNNVLLRCENDAKPPSHSYKWYWNGEEIFQKTSDVLELQKVEVWQSGDYFCTASNEISENESQSVALIVSYSRATVMKRTLISLGCLAALLVLVGLLVCGLRRRKKLIDPVPGSTGRSGSFFVKKAKGGRLCNDNNRLNDEGRESSLGFPNQGAEDAITYAAIRLPPDLSNEQVIYSRIKGQKWGADPSDESVIYSVVKKPELLSKGDTKPDYENIVNPNEEELHYSSLVNLAPRPQPTFTDSESNSDSEDSIHYAALKH
uniref:B-cell receptor CD22 n=1 Tax=Pogona vitticeps TaxID=103695 RepID=A0ABM5EQZ1_9SAUR